MELKSDFIIRFPETSVYVSESDFKAIENTLIKNRMDYQLIKEVHFDNPLTMTVTIVTEPHFFLKLYLGTVGTER